LSTRIGFTHRRRTTLTAAFLSKSAEWTEGQGKQRMQDSVQRDALGTGLSLTPKPAIIAAARLAQG